MKWFKSVGKFIGRQARTKTGQYAMSLIATVAVGQVAGDEITARVPEIVGHVFNVINDPQNALFALGAMYLRDKEAKAEARKRAK